MKRLLLGLIVIVLIVAGVGTYKTFSTPSDLYVETAVFAACPKRPSCVSSIATDDPHRVAALGYTGDSYTAFVILRDVIERMGGEVHDQRDGYLHAVFTDPRFKLRDDLEVLMLPEGRIDVRAASRFAWTDFGKNRARVEELRRSFEAMPPAY